MLLDVQTREELLNEKDSPNRYARNCESRGPGSLGTIIRDNGRILQVTSYNTSGHACCTFVDEIGARTGHIYDWSDWQKVEVLFYAPIDMDYNRWVAKLEGRV